MCQEVHLILLDGPVSESINQELGVGAWYGSVRWYSHLRDLLNVRRDWLCHCSCTQCGPQLLVGLVPWGSHGHMLLP